MIDRDIFCAIVHYAVYFMNEQKIRMKADERQMQNYKKRNRSDENMQYEASEKTSPLRRREQELVLKMN